MDQIIILITALILVCITVIILLFARKKNKKKSVKKKEPVPNVAATVADIIPIVDIVDEDTKNPHFITKKGRHIDIYEIRTSDLSSMTPEELQLMVNRWELFYKTCKNDMKIIALNLPTDTEQQQKYLNYKVEKTHNEIYRPFLEEELDVLKFIANHRMDRYYYLMVFCKDKNDYDETQYVIDTKLISPFRLASKISLKEKIVVLSKLGDKNSHMTSKDEPLIDRRDYETQRKIVKKKGYNPYLLSDIGPAGGISFNVEKYIKTGSGYESCISIYRYPNKVGLYWLLQLTGKNNSVVTIDIHSADYNKTIQNLNRSIDENFKRAQNEKEVTEIDDAYQKIGELRGIASSMNREGQVMKYITCRIFLFARTFAEIEEATGTIMEQLRADGFECAVYVNESRNDWLSQFTSYNEQQRTIYKRVGQPILSLALAKGLPFYFTSLADPQGLYLGDTNANQGSVLFNPFTKTTTRLSYNLIINGMMGAGKSSTLKKLLKMMAMLGYYFRILDPTGEYENIVGRFGGRTISLDGTSGILNALEILKTSDEGENMSFNYHLAKLKTCYLMLDSTATSDEVYLFQEKVSELYQYCGIINSYQEINEQQLTGLPADRYPIWSDFYDYLQYCMDNLKPSKDPIQQAKTIEESKLLNKISRKIKTLINNYGSLVNGHTSIDNILDEPLINFSTRELDKMDPTISNMQLFLALQLSYDNLFRVGSHMKELSDNKAIEPWDVTYGVLLIDEAHKFLNASRPDIVDIVTRMQREARKYFVGIWLSSQAITDFIPEGSDQASINSVKQLFGFSEIKMLLRQNLNARSALKQAFGEDLLKDQDIDELSKMDMGSMLMCIGAERKLQLHVELTQDEIDMFSGGV